jgi:rRNA maturation endonuclease Nob1
MSLLDKVKQGMLESTKAIKEISSEMSEMSKLKVSLAKEKGKLEELYYHLGKAIIHPETASENAEIIPEDALLILYEAQAAVKNIKEYESKIEQLKGIVKCSQCGTIFDEDAKFCSKCGSKLEPEPVVPEIIEESETEEEAMESAPSAVDSQELNPVEKPEE